MKKGLANFCLLIFLLSQSGYLVYLYNLNKVNKIMDSRIVNHDFKDQNLLEMKIPLHLPYYLDQKDYQSVHGEITWKGIIFNYVKSKVKSDTLYLLCLRNDIKTDWLINKVPNSYMGLKLKGLNCAYLKGYNNISSFSFLPYFFPGHLSKSPSLTLESKRIKNPNTYNIINPLLPVSEIPPDSILSSEI